MKWLQVWATLFHNDKAEHVSVSIVFSSSSLFLREPWCFELERRSRFQSACMFLLDYFADTLAWSISAILEGWPRFLTNVKTFETQLRVSWERQELRNEERYSEDDLLNANRSLHSEAGCLQAPCGTYVTSGFVLRAIHSRTFLSPCAHVDHLNVVQNGSFSFQLDEWEIKLMWLKLPDSAI